MSFSGEQSCIYSKGELGICLRLANYLSLYLGLLIAAVPLLVEMVVNAWWEIKGDAQLR